MTVASIATTATYYLATDVPEIVNQMNPVATPISTPSRANNVMMLIQEVFPMTAVVLAVVLSCKGGSSKRHKTFVGKTMPWRTMPNGSASSYSVATAATARLATPWNLTVEIGCYAARQMHHRHATDTPLFMTAPNK